MAPGCAKKKSETATHLVNRRDFERFRAHGQTCGVNSPMARRVFQSFRTNDKELFYEQGPPPFCPGR